MLNSKKIKAELPSIISAHIDMQIDKIIRMNEAMLLTEEQHKAIDKLARIHNLSFENEPPNGDENAPGFRIYHILRLDEHYRAMQRIQKKQEDMKKIDNVFDNWKIENIPTIVDGLPITEKTETEIVQEKTKISHSNGKKAVNWMLTAFRHWEAA